MTILSNFCLFLLCFYNAIEIDCEAKRFLRDGCIECRRITKISYGDNSKWCSSTETHDLAHFLFLIRCYRDKATGKITSLRTTCFERTPGIQQTRHKYITVQPPVENEFTRESYRHSNTHLNTDQPPYDFLTLPKQWFRNIFIFAKSIFPSSEVGTFKDVCLECGKHNQYVPDISHGTSSMRQFLLVVLGPTTKRNLQGNICQLVDIKPYYPTIANKQQKLERNTTIFGRSDINISIHVLAVNHSGVTVDFDSTKKLPLTSVVVKPLPLESRLWNLFSLVLNGTCDSYQHKNQIPKHRKINKNEEMPVSNEIKDSWFSSMVNTLFESKDVVDKADADSNQNIAESNGKSTSELNWWNLLPLYSKHMSIARTKKILEVPPTRLTDEETKYNTADTGYGYGDSDVEVNITEDSQQKREQFDLQPSSIVEVTSPATENSLSPNKTRMDHVWFEWFMNALRLRTAIPHMTATPNLTSSISLLDFAVETESVTSESETSPPVQTAIEDELVVETTTATVTIQPEATNDLPPMKGVTGVVHSGPKKFVERWRHRKYGGEVTDCFVLFILFTSVMLFIVKTLSHSFKRNIPKEETNSKDDILKAIPPMKQYEMEIIVAIAEISPYSHMQPNIVF